MRLSLATIEQLARRIHENYLARFGCGATEGATTPAMVPWDDLSDDLREVNRAQARDIVAMLDRIDCEVRPGPDPDRFEFAPAEIELLAQVEHRLWARQRRAAGWTYGAIRDDEQRRHPNLVPWGKLSELAREKDRDAVRNIPSVLAAAGLHIARRSGPRPKRPRARRAG